MTKKLDITLSYEELTDLLDVMEEGLISKESKGEDISKVRQTYFSLVNLWGDNASVDEPKDFERIVKYLENQIYEDSIKGIISFDKDINDENVLDNIYNKYMEEDNMELLNEDLIK